MEPEGWSTEKLKTLLKGGVKNGYSPIASDQETGYWVLGLGALGDDGFNCQEVKPVELTEKVRGALLNPGDFLVSRSNTPDKVGRSIMYKGEISQCSYPDLMMRFRVNPESASPEFIEHKLKSSSIRRYFKSSAAGSSGSMVKINKGVLENTPIYLPPLPEQKKIAQILSTWDQAIIATERLLENSQQRKKGLMQQLLTGKKRLPGFEGEWEKTTLGSIGKISSAGVDKKIVDGEKGARLLNYLDVFRREFIFDHELTHAVTAPDRKIANCDVRKGDVFFTPSSETRDEVGIPAVAVEDMPGVVYSYHVVRFRPKRPLDLNFAAYAFQTDEFRSQTYRLCDGSGQRYVLSQDDFRCIWVTIPSLDEQKAIGHLLKAASDEISALSDRINLLKYEKKALMQQLLTGKRRVQVDTEAA